MYWLSTPYIFQAWCWIWTRVIILNYKLGILSNSVFCAKTNPRFELEKSNSHLSIFLSLYPTWFLGTFVLVLCKIWLPKAQHSHTLQIISKSKYWPLYVKFNFFLFVSLLFSIFSIAETNKLSNPSTTEDLPNGFNSSET